MVEPFPLSVLDLATVDDGLPEAAAVNQVVELAQHAESLGYRRFWTAEHHSVPTIASTAPDLLAMRVADRTSTIRVGSGGVMLPNHAPFAVAERFLMLEAFHPRRIDLGVGRAPGTDPITAHALHRGDAGDYVGQLDELDAFLDGRFPADHPYAHVSAMPRGSGRPPVHLLGSSMATAELAARRGASFGFASHFSPMLTIPAMHTYRATFTPGRLAKPHAILTVAVIAAPTDRQAHWIAGATRLAYLRTVQGLPGKFPSPEESARHSWTHRERSLADGYTGSHVIGGPDTVRTRLRELVATTSADELMVTANIHGLEDRRRNLELVAELTSDVVAHRDVA